MSYLDRLYNLRDAAMVRGDATAYNDFQKLIDYEHRDHPQGGYDPRLLISPASRAALRAGA